MERGYKVTPPVSNKLLKKAKYTTYSHQIKYMHIKIRTEINCQYHKLTKLLFNPEPNHKPLIPINLNPNKNLIAIVTPSLNL